MHSENKTLRPQQHTCKVCMPPDRRRRCMFQGDTGHTGHQGRLNLQVATNTQSRRSMCFSRQAVSTGQSRPYYTHSPITAPIHACMAACLSMLSPCQPALSCGATHLRCRTQRSSHTRAWTRHPLALSDQWGRAVQPHGTGQGCLRRAHWWCQRDKGHTPPWWVHQCSSRQHLQQAENKGISKV